MSSGPAPFLKKLYIIVDDNVIDALVSWSQGNNSFLVWKPVEFARQVLPEYFKHNNFHSFLRQLSTYGFRRMDPDRWEFANPNFIRGQRHLLKNIERRKPVPHHHLQTPQQQQQTQGSLGPCVEVGKFRKPVPQLHLQTPQQQQQTQGSLGPCVEVGKFRLEDQVESLKRDSKVLNLQLMNARQRQQTTEHDLQLMRERLDQSEEKLKSYLADVYNPSFFAQLVPNQDTENFESWMMNTDPLDATLFESTSEEIDMQVCPREPTSVPMGETPTEFLPFDSFSLL